MTAKTETSRARDSRIRKGAWLASFAVASLALPTLAFAAEESKSENIGPWEIEATFKADKFDRCSINRKLDDDIVASFVRTGDGLTLELESPNWKLERGKQYPVKMTLGPLSFDTEVAAEPNSVSMDVKDKKFAAGLRSRQRAERGRRRRHDPRARSTRARSRSSGWSNASRRTTRRSKPTLLWLRHVSPSGWRVGGRRPQLPARDQGYSRGDTPSGGGDAHAGGYAQSGDQSGADGQIQDRKISPVTVFSAKGRSVPVGSPMKVRQKAVYAAAPPTGTACNASTSSSVKTRLRVRKRMPSGASTEKP